MKKTAALLSAVLLLLSSWTFTALADTSFSQWKTEGWTARTENGEQILYGNPQESMNLLFTKSTVNDNCLEFDIYMEDSTGTDDGCIGAAYKCSNGFQYFFEYNTVHQMVRIRRIGDGVNTEVAPTKAHTLELRKWYTFKLIFAENRLEFYIDGKLIHSAADTAGDPLMGGTCYIQGYFATPRLKNVRLHSEKIEPGKKPEGGQTQPMDYDFEFTASESVKGFEAKNGSVSYKNHALIYTLKGSGYLQSPQINAEKGSPYSALLTVKNTLFVRLKNKTAASSVKVYFITSADGAYNEEKSREFEIEPNSGYRSYFFNLSGLAGMKGYLRGFRIVPQGASGGTLSIDAITFEREKAFYDYAGEILSCTADGKQVTIKGTLNSNYAGKTIQLFELDATNYTQSIKGLKPIAEVTADGTSFTFTVPYMGEQVSRLSSLFMAAVDGVKVSDRFMVENYRDFSENPYAFKLPDYTVDATDARFGAAGDAFTNDTASIQAAIDHVSSKGGGTVVIPGDASYYGKRYVVTNLKLKDNVELRLEKGAMLWQSPRAWDYEYEVAYGHDVSIPGVNWAHAASCHNYPLIQGDNAKNIKLTGGGTLRCIDAGGENLDTISSDTIWTGCANRIHVVPIGFWKCENVEISDIVLMRTNNYHINMRTCEQVYIGNVEMTEVTCAGGDGISATVGTKRMVIDRCVLYTNDDAVTICSTYNDPRGLAWWHANPDGDNCIDELTVMHSNLHGGHGITFITWGTDAPDLSLQEIKNVEVFDCVLGGGMMSVGAWPDNPYYGRVPFDGTETNDFSPVKNVRIHNNAYKGVCNLEALQATNFITDCGLHSAENFLNGDFERKNGKSGWVSGLSNWSFTEGSDVSVTEADGSHKGVLRSVGRLYQGLYMGAGQHEFTIEAELLSGKGRVFIENAETGETVFEQTLAAGEKSNVSFLFSMVVGNTYCFGAELTEAGEVRIDKANIKTTPPVYPQFFTENFQTLENATFDFSAWKLAQEGSNVYLSTPTGATGIHSLSLAQKYQEFDLQYAIRIREVSSDVDGNIAISYCRTDANTQYYAEYNTVHGYFTIRRFAGGAEKNLAKKQMRLESDQWYTIGLRTQNGRTELYLNGERLLSAEDSKPLNAASLVLFGYNTAFDTDCITVAEAGTLDMSAVIDVNADTTAKTYLLSFDADGGTPAPEPQYLEAGASPAAVAAPTKAGFIFSGWLYNGKKIELSEFKMPHGDAALTAQWTANAAPAPASTGVIIALSAVAVLLLAAAASAAVIFARKRKQQS